jgi:hypothetical protein
MVGLDATMMGAGRASLYHPLVPAAERGPRGDNVELGVVSTGVVGTLQRSRP